MYITKAEQTRAVFCRNFPKKRRTYMADAPSRLCATKGSTFMSVTKIDHFHLFRDTIIITYYGNSMNRANHG